LRTAIVSSKFEEVFLWVNQLESELGEAWSSSYDSARTTSFLIAPRNCKQTTDHMDLLEKPLEAAKRELICFQTVAREFTLIEQLMEISRHCRSQTVDQVEMSLRYAIGRAGDVNDYGSSCRALLLSMESISRYINAKVFGDRSRAEKLLHELNEVA